jgi:hypothetical protein
MRIEQLKASSLALHDQRACPQWGVDGLFPLARSFGSPLLVGRRPGSTVPETVTAPSVGPLASDGSGKTFLPGQTIGLGFNTHPQDQCMATTEPGAAIGKATEADLEGILALQAANQIKRGGMLSAELPRLRIAEMMHRMPLIVARRDRRVTGFLMTTTRTMNAELPVVLAMFRAYSGSLDAYVYGPICVDPAERGKSLAAAMFAELRRLEPGREGVLLIRIDNEASLRAHKRMGMQEVARFKLDGVDFAVFSYVG